MRGRFRKTKRALFHLAVRSLQLLARAMPRPLALATFAAISDIVRWIDRPAVRRALENIDIAYGQTIGPAARARIVRGMFRATGRNLVDIMRPFPRDPRRAADLVRFEGLQHLDAALQEGRGVVALSAHLGNWEVLGAALAVRGYAVHVVAREIFDRRSDRVLNAWRERAGIRIHRQGESLVGIRRALRDNGVLGMLVDQDMGGPSVFEAFYGHPARTPIAPFVLARRAGAPLVPMWIRMDRDGKHTATVLPALPNRMAETPDAVLRADIQEWHRRLEAAISAHPKQWIWHHRRWRTRPSGPLAERDESSRRLTEVVARPATREVALTR